VLRQASMFVYQRLVEVSLSIAGIGNQMNHHHCKSQKRRIKYEVESICVFTLLMTKLPASAFVKQAKPDRFSRV
jgi:hypothetical protein